MRSGVAAGRPSSNRSICATPTRRGRRPRKPWRSSARRTSWSPTRGCRSPGLSRRPPLDPDSITRSAAVNFVGPVAHALPLVEAMRECGAGHLIGSSTANARLTIPGWGPYVASKSAWDAWLRAAAAELAPHGVAVTILAFPLVATEMARPTLAERRAMSAEDAADWISEAIGSRRPRIAPWWLRAAEVAHAVAPTALARAIGRSSQRLSQP